MQAAAVSISAPLLQDVIPFLNTLPALANISVTGRHFPGFQIQSWALAALGAKLEALTLTSGWNVLDWVVEPVAHPERKEEADEDEELEVSEEEPSFSEEEHDCSEEWEELSEEERMNPRIQMRVQDLSQLLAPWHNSLRSLHLVDCCLPGTHLNNNSLFLAFPHLWELQLASVSTAPSSTALSLAGCSSLRSLDCCDCGLKSLDVKGCMGLTSLSWSDSTAKKLDLSPCPGLVHVLCQNNPRLYTLDLTPCKEHLQSVECIGNHIEILDIAGCAHLVKLDCSNNWIGALALDLCTRLESLDCRDNQLQKLLDVSHCTALQHLHCKNNLITALCLTGCTNLQTVECWSNQYLASVEAFDCPRLEYLNCGLLPLLTQLDLSECHSLKKLDFHKCNRNLILSPSVELG